VDGGPIDPNNPFINSIRLPAFSPNGQTIAYGYKGLNFFAVATGVSNRVIEDEIDDLGNNLLVVREAYSPNKYSADGIKLLLTLHYYEGGSAAIYYPAANSLVRLSNDEGALICCGEPEWTQDGSALFVGNPTIGMFNPGLWRVDASNGTVATLLGGDSNFVDEPYLAPDNQLYYFYSDQLGTPETANRPSLQLVRSAADGITNRTVVIPDSFLLLNEALWASDASLVIVATAPIAEVYQGGLIELYYTDGKRGMVSLLDYGQQLRWGP
jgi:Tol biopolymer transport system component